MADELDESGALVSGPFAGQKPEDALKQVIGIAQERETENQRLRAAAAKPPEPASEPPKPKGLDWEVVQGDDREAAAKHMAEFTDNAVTTLLDKRLGDERAKTFPADRQRAKEQAAAMVARDGQDWNEFGGAIDTAMTEANGASQAQQTDPNAWYGLFIAAKGKQAMTPAIPAAPFTERPSPATRAGQKPAADYYEMPEEAEVHRRFDEMTGHTSTPEEWAHLRDNVNTQKEWDALERDKEQRQKVGRR